jgi:hypothetical protein
LKGVIFAVWLKRNREPIASKAIEGLEDIDQLNIVSPLDMEVLAVHLHRVPGRDGELPGAVSSVRIFARVAWGLNSHLLVIVKISMATTRKSINLLLGLWRFRKPSRKLCNVNRYGWKISWLRRIQS